LSVADESFEKSVPVDVGVLLSLPDELSSLPLLPHAARKRASTTVTINARTARVRDEAAVKMGPLSEGEWRECSAMSS
jgi:hypothetical protein